MTEPFLGEIQPFAFDFPPRGWAQCRGGQIAISQNTALYSLIGTAYGGDGRTYFLLPDIGERIACSQGHGPGLSPRQVGDAFGAALSTLSQAQMPAHSHAMHVFAQSDQSKRTAQPQDGSGLVPPTSATPFAGGATPDAAFALGTGSAGQGQPHENRQPFLAMNFCIALQGVFPPFD
jgi:microcystin-dependent protein